MAKALKKYRRNISGKSFRQIVCYKAKSKAQERAKILRAKGKKVRVVPELGGWGVYITE